jgi:transcriptional regulator with XRE-family HTH domain
VNATAAMRQSVSERDKTLAAQLERLRKKKGLTQAQLAELAGVQLATVVRLEHARSGATWATVKALARALGVKPNAFLDPPKE